MFFRIIVILLVLCAPCFGLKVPTHEAINEKNAKSNHYFDLHKYLVEKADLPSGLQQKLGEHEAYKWIALGGKYEDVLGDGFFQEYVGQLIVGRYANHFHNPSSQSIDTAGFTGLFGGLMYSGDSALRWAQLEEGDQVQGGSYSWKDARSYYYQALTALDTTTQEELFAKNISQCWSGYAPHARHECSCSYS